MTTMKTPTRRGPMEDATDARTAGAEPGGVAAWTAEKVAALPIVAPFTYEIRVIDGAKVRVPMAADVKLVFVTDADVDRYVDAAGVKWKLCQLLTGEYARISPGRV